MFFISSWIKTFCKQLTNTIIHCWIIVINCLQYFHPSSGKNISGIYCELVSQVVSFIPDKDYSVAFFYTWRRFAIAELDNTLSVAYPSTILKYRKYCQKKCFECDFFKFML